MNSVSALWATILTPSARDEDGYTWACIFLGHAVLGLAIGQAFGAEAAGSRALLAAVYWLVKERGDLRRGGSLLDGAADALALWAGAYMAERWVAVMVLATAAGGAWVKEARRP